MRQQQEEERRKQVSSKTSSKEVKLGVCGLCVCVSLSLSDTSCSIRESFTSLQLALLRERERRMCAGGRRIGSAEAPVQRVVNK
jgi:hypothetical protein